MEFGKATDYNRKKSGSTNRWIGAKFDSDDPKEKVIIEKFDYLLNQCGGNTKRAIAEMVIFVYEKVHKDN